MKTYIVAEMAWSHTGDLSRAIDLLEKSAKAGADAISIHITHMPTYMTKTYACIEGSTLSDSAEQNSSIYDYLSRINLTQDDWIRFNSYAKDLGIDLIVMCNDRESFEFSKTLDVHKYVISAASFLEQQLIEDMVRQNPDLIIRTGGATLEEVDSIVDLIFDASKRARICLLAGIQLYPTPIQDLQLASLSALADRYSNRDVSVGLADHIDGDDIDAIYLPGLAVALGAVVIEKHITTDRKEKLEDYEAALGMDQFEVFVNYIRKVEAALGGGTLDYMSDSPAYKKYRAVTRKKVVAASDLPAGTLLTRELLAFKRADHGSQLDRVKDLIGCRLISAKNCDDGIELKDVKRD